MVLDRFPTIRGLSPEEKLLLVGELWDDLSNDPDSVPVSESVLDELDSRFAEYDKNPDQTVPWSEARARIRASRKS
ncbi:MAG: putative addiction module component (TIGR02574 family) [Verrucomicrobiales bacterium]|jgi:putative addiction module component (TIGR02574 family)